MGGIWQGMWALKTIMGQRDGTGNLPCPAEGIRGEKQQLENQTHLS